MDRGPVAAGVHHHVCVRGLAAASGISLRVLCIQRTNASHFIGLDNFRQVLFEAPFSAWTWRAAEHNAVVFVSLMMIQNSIAFLIAFALLKKLPGHRLHRVIIFLPVVLSAIIVGFLWKLFLHPLFGLVNQTLALVGIQGRAWLGDEGTALGSIIFANTWHWVGFPALIFLAGMQRVAAETLEAARLDGAGDWDLMTKIIWPLVAPIQRSCSSSPLSAASIGLNFLM